MNLKTIARTRFALAGAGTSTAPAPSSPLQLKQLGSQLGNHLRTAWKWVDQGYTKQRLSKRLKVAETVSLGEKRFVSILQVDGAQFLIGGTASSVSLLATLDQSATAQPQANFADILRMKSASSPAAIQAEQE